MRSSHCIASVRARITLPDVPATLAAHRHVAETQCRVLHHRQQHLHLVGRMLGRAPGQAEYGRARCRGVFRTCAG